MANLFTFRFFAINLLREEVAEEIFCSCLNNNLKIQVLSLKELNFVTKNKKYCLLTFVSKMTHTCMHIQNMLKRREDIRMNVELNAITCCILIFYTLR